jgi:hypothetical protein
MLAQEALTSGICLGKRGFSLTCDQFTHVRAVTVRTWAPPWAEATLGTG